MSELRFRSAVILVLGFAAVDALGLENVNKRRANLAGDDFDRHSGFPFRPYMGIRFDLHLLCKNASYSRY